MSKENPSKEECTQQLALWGNIDMMSGSHFLNCQDESCEYVACVSRRDSQRRIEELESTLKTIYQKCIARKGRMSENLRRVVCKLTAMAHKGHVRVYEKE